MIRPLAYYAAVTAWTALLFPVAILSLLVSWDGTLSIRVARGPWARGLLRIGGITLHVHGVENVDPARPTIYVSNHQSTADIPALFAALPVNFRVVAKSQLRWVPLVGQYLWMARHILIDRGNSRKAVESLERAAARIRAGTSLIMYAEGSRSPDQTVLPFKKGPFSLAVRAGVAICPVTIEGSGRAMSKNSWQIHPGPIHVKIGAPIDASAYGISRRDELIRDVRNVIIDQSLALGGKGGDREDAIAAQGYEGIGRAQGKAP
ncbi:MAG: 1-acyl-sn-glycerol-3-phosphate acyltransferase [Deltaproteobacteria bacterium]|nr:1-acyl-sn-glycerol-3-phosphate acyltransferase [Deltaproteobacteria bacterium]